MADVISIHNATGVVHTGKGQLYGIVLTASVGNPLCTISEGILGGGAKRFEAYGSVGHPLVIFFPDHFAPRFVTGLFITLAANLTCTLWTRQL